MASSNSRIRIGINAVVLTGGGAAVALDKLLSEFVRRRPDIEYHVVGDANIREFASTAHPNLFRHSRPRTGGIRISFALWHSIGLPLWLRRNNIDVLFTHTCYLPLTIRTPNVLLMQDARYFCDIGAAAGVLDDQGLGFLLKKYWTYRSLRTARVVTVQSNTLADSIAARIPSAAPRIRVIPHGPGFLDGPQPRTPAAMWRGETLELLCISLFRKYKNFPVLLRMLRSLRTSQIPARLHLTLDETDPGVGQLWREARGLGVEDCLVNHGEVRTEQLSQLYRDADAFVFASVCESFGFPLIEAMSFGIPVFAADTPINREICGPAAAYFPPGDPQSLADLLRCYLARPELRSSASQESIRRSQRFSWTSAGEQTLNLILDQLPNSCAPGQSRV